MDNQMSNTPSGPPPAGDPDKKKRLMFVVIVVVAMLLLLGATFVLMNSKKEPTNNTGQNNAGNTADNSGDNTGTQNQSTSPCTTAGTKAYENKQLGFGFCYPIAWGAPSVTDAKMAEGDVGSRWRVNFASKDEVHAGAVSDDWATNEPRDGTCLDPAMQVLPPFDPFNTSWITEGTPTISATRDREVKADDFLIQERVDELLTNGVCLEGYKIINGTYPHVSATYYKQFYSTVTTPDMHIGSPDFLIPDTDRDAFTAFVKSIYKLES
jgi:hypothetical protein